MLISCPNCKKRFEIALDPNETVEKKLRCSNCRAVFRLVRKGQEKEREAPAARLKVVVANESAAFCEAVRKVLATESFEIFICNDGKVALDTVERVRPEVLLLDVALPTMFGFEVCERVRQNPALSNVKIVLIASIYDKTRYKRSPNSLYGADDYIEKHHIPDRLVPMVYQLASVTAPMEKPTAAELASHEAARSEIRDVEVRETSAEAAATQVARPGEPPVKAPPVKDPPVQEPPVKEPPVKEPPVKEPPVKEPPAQKVAPEEAPAIDWSDLSDAPSAPGAAAAVSEMESFAGREAAAEPAPLIGDAPVQPAPVLSEAHVKARRLARIIVSDIVLYNQGKVEQGVREGSFFDILADDIREGERLYRQRVPEEIRDSTTFLKDAFDDLIAKKRAELCA